MNKEYFRRTYTHTSTYTYTMLFKLTFVESIGGHNEEGSMEEESDDNHTEVPGGQFTDIDVVITIAIARHQINQLSRVTGIVS